VPSEPFMVASEGEKKIEKKRKEKKKSQNELGEPLSSDPLNNIIIRLLNRFTHISSPPRPIPFISILLTLPFS